ncbi:MAG TPA: ATP-binding cassette domain-containing protein [Conexibacter sp.]|nr:ATP-binding cassette domain-containing protein [Conexibacter sp.]
MAIRSLYVEPERAAEPLEWPALECRDVFRIFRSGPVETVALRGLDVRVEAGETVAVFGPSGSGKSTFLTLAAGLDEPSAGEVRVHGLSLARLDEAELARYRARELAIVFQSENLWTASSARENVLATLRLAGVADAGRRADDALAAFGLERRAHERAGALSGGEQQRVAIAAAAARRARLVLADEPTAELDEQNERTVLAALLHLRAEHGATVVVVTHSERVAEAVDRVIELRDGRAVS